MARRVTSGLNVSLSSRLVSPARGQGPVIKAGKQNYSEIRVRAPWPEARSSNWPIFAVIDHQLPETRDIPITRPHETERRATAKLSASSLSVHRNILESSVCKARRSLIPLVNRRRAIKGICRETPATFPPDFYIPRANAGRYLVKWSVWETVMCQF